ncbi:hypothetical protein GF345_04655 [Candidatus Woesearchaeota archaeon]|nr:hypothetical protein [Candidatus Woesearchaeota archaeon]
MRIILVPFEDAGQDALDRLAHEISSMTQAEIILSEKTELPNLRWREEQACANDFIPFLMEAAAAAGADYAVGITKHDLYDFNNPHAKYLFGFASGNSSIISSSRLKGDFFLNRLSKEAKHELGRCLGMSHCDNPKCVMSSPNSVEDIDLKNRTLCQKCSEKIRSSL